ncbi:hypothetical protein [Actinoplanes xinjiangensis]|uniref:hypothetical protein n=1 Tax=Actinoplanes xinjiangensis TaxID=512350 RepID=UPI003422A85A
MNDEKSLSESSERSAPPVRRPAPQPMAVLFVLVAATVVSGIAGLLSHASGSNVPGAVLTAGGAFAGAVGLFLAIAHYVSAR